jgi:hypothetical protein
MEPPGRVGDRVPRDALVRVGDRNGCAGKRRSALVADAPGNGAELRSVGKKPAGKKRTQPSKNKSGDSATAHERPPFVVPQTLPPNEIAVNEIQSRAQPRPF